MVTELEVADQNAAGYEEPDPYEAWLASTAKEVRVVRTTMGGIFSVHYPVDGPRWKWRYEEEPALDRVEGTVARVCRPTALGERDSVILYGADGIFAVAIEEIDFDKSDILG